jgi:hypothetical protein
MIIGSIIAIILGIVVGARLVFWQELIVVGVSIVGIFLLAIRMLFDFDFMVIVFLVILFWISMFGIDLIQFFHIFPSS